MLDTNTEYGRNAEYRLVTDVIGWLATVRPSGQPDVVPVWFLWDKGEILIYSRPAKLKLRNVTQNPRVALVIDDTRGGGDVVRVEGTGRVVAGHPRANTVPEFIAKYAGPIERIGYTPDSFADTYTEAIRITPERIGR